MTHDELLAQVVEKYNQNNSLTHTQIAKALLAVVELHIGKGIGNRCVSCANGNKCETIQAIEKELG